MYSQINVNGVCSKEKNTSHMVYMKHIYPTFDKKKIHLNQNTAQQQIVQYNINA